VLGYLGLSLGNICGFFSSIGRVFDRTVNLPHFIQLAVENNGLNNSRSEGEEEQDYSSPFSTGASAIRAAALVAIGIGLAGLGYRQMGLPNRVCRIPFHCRWNAHYSRLYFRVEILNRSQEPPIPLDILQPYTIQFQRR
jgi:hypothetical protein